MLTILTNDDGIDAPGLGALAEAAAGENGAADLLTVAPREAVSECSHRVTTKGPLTIETRGPGRYAVDGSPADCTRVALLHLVGAWRSGVDLRQVRVLSGINAGGNLGADIYISGTVAAVREACFFGVHGVAFSQYRRTVRGATEAVDWKRAGRWVGRALAAIEQKPWPEGAFWNVNFPWLSAEAAEPGIVFCPRSRRPLPVKYQQAGQQLTYVSGLYHQRSFEAGSDIAVCFGGAIAISLIEL